MPNVEQPAAVGLATLAHGRDGLVDSRVGLHPSRAQIVECAEHVVVPERWKRELTPRRFDDVARREPPQQTAVEEILVRSATRVCHAGVGAKCLLECEQPLEYANCRVERGAHRATFCLTVPAAVIELL